MTYNNLYVAAQPSVGSIACTKARITTPWGVNPRVLVGPPYLVDLVDDRVATHVERCIAQNGEARDATDRME